MSSNNVQVYFNKTEMNILNEQVYEKINAQLKNMHTLSEVNKCKLSNCEKCINFFLLVLIKLFNFIIYFLFLK